MDAKDKENSMILVNKMRLRMFIQMCTDAHTSKDIDMWMDALINESSNNIWVENGNGEYLLIGVKT